MSVKDDVKAGTFQHGTGTLCFTDEYGRLRELVGEILVARKLQRMPP